MRQRSALLVLLPLLLMTAACGGGSGDADPPGEDSLAAGGIRQTDNDLVIEVQASPDAPVRRYTLVCAGVVEGDHPDAEAACQHLASLDEPFRPIPADAICTEQYGGDQTARITGQWQREPVDLSLSRVDGCHIAQWDRLGPVLPGPVGVDVH